MSTKPADTGIVSRLRKMEPHILQGERSVGVPPGSPEAAGGPMVKKKDRKRVLLVDDEKSIRLTLPRVLAKYGFEVTSLAGLDDALAEIKAQDYDVLLSDLNLREPNAGFTVIDEMRKAQPRCLNFVLTGYPTDQSLREAQAGNVTHYFAKPVEIKQLVNTIREELQRASSRKPCAGEDCND